jgi:hypothetical protein
VGVVGGIAFFRLGHIHYRWNPLVRQAALRVFVQKSISCSCLDPAAYYELRDQYSGGVFSVKPEEISTGGKWVMLQDAHLDTYDQIVAHPLFASPSGRLVLSTKEGTIIQNDQGTIIQLQVEASRAAAIHGFAQHFKVKFPPESYWYSYALFR